MTFALRETVICGTSDGRFAKSHKVRGHMWDLRAVVDACQDGTFLCSLLQRLEHVVVREPSL